MKTIGNESELVVHVVSDSSEADVDVKNKHEPKFKNSRLGKPQNKKLNLSVVNSTTASSRSARDGADGDIATPESKSCDNVMEPEGEDDNNGATPKSKSCDNAIEPEGDEDEDDGGKKEPQEPNQVRLIIGA